MAWDRRLDIRRSERYGTEKGKYQLTRQRRPFGEPVGQGTAEADVQNYAHLTCYAMCPCSFTCIQTFVFMLRDYTQFFGLLVDAQNEHVSLGRIIIIFTGIKQARKFYKTYLNQINIWLGPISCCFDERKKQKEISVFKCYVEQMAQSLERIGRHTKWW